MEVARRTIPASGCCRGVRSLSLPACADHDDAPMRSAHVSRPTSACAGWGAGVGEMRGLRALAADLGVPPQIMVHADSHRSLPSRVARHLASRYAQTDSASR